VATRDAGEATSVELDRLEAEITASCQRQLRRRERRPTPTFPADLPVSARRDEIAAAIREHQVVILCGATGSGKSTQLPKICLEAGRGLDGLIGHTQPRRIAARSVATRVARELGGEVGGLVGCTVRFEDRTAPETLIRFMTDGVLLAETQHDRLLRQYDTIIIDEAHERTLTIDFLLGYLRQLLSRRPDLKVIITSATIDPGRFSAHFANAPIIEVSGRTYPVEIRWRPPVVKAGEADDDDALMRALVDAVDELEGIDRERSLPPGDVLVFLPGEREIGEAMEALGGRSTARDGGREGGRGGSRDGGGRAVEFIPLYARLSLEEQDRIFEPRRGRRLVLATNIAETSLTVPGVRHVVDLGLARISRFSSRTRVQRLPIEPISQASADQRAGRCGRTEPGICIRLWSEEEHAERPRYTDPEIVRTNLAAVILQMKSLRLGTIEQFPFIDPPSAKHITAGHETLHEIGAVDVEGALTTLGKELSRYPIDPRLARMILAGRDEGCLQDMLVIAAALATQDPRLRPSDRADAADLAHLRFRDETSDFVGMLKVWDAWQLKLAEVSRGELSGNASRRWCRDSFLSYIRLREWQDVHGQLMRIFNRSLAGERSGPSNGSGRSQGTGRSTGSGRSRRSGGQNPSK